MARLVALLSLFHGLPAPRSPLKLQVWWDRMTTPIEEDLFLWQEYIYVTLLDLQSSQG